MSISSQAVKSLHGRAGDAAVEKKSNLMAKVILIQIKHVLLAVAQRQSLPGALL